MNQICQKLNSFNFAENTQMYTAGNLEKSSHLVNELVAPVVSLAGLALAVLVVEAGAHALHDRGGREVLRGDELDAAELAVPLLLHERVHFRVELREGLAGSRGAQSVRHGRCSP